MSHATIRLTVATFACILANIVFTLIMYSSEQDDWTVSRPRWRSAVASVVETASSTDTLIRYAAFTPFNY